MTLLMFDGFEDKASTAQVGQRWSGNIGINGMSLSYARSGVWGLRCGGSGPTVAHSFVGADEHATAIAGEAVRTDSVSGAEIITNGSLFVFRSDNGATTHVTIELLSDGRITARRGTTGGTLLGTSPNPVIQPNIWRYIECKVVLHDTTGSVEVRADGHATPVLLLTGIDTKNAGTKTVFDTVGLGGWGGSYFHIDDLYICNGAGTINNDFLGDVSVLGITPNGNGNASQLVGSDGNSTDNYLLVDELPPASADYVGSATDDQQDTYLMTDVPANVDIVHGLMIMANAAKSDASAKAIASLVRTGGTDYAGSDQALSVSYVYYSRLLQTNPATGVKWTEAEINAIELGARVRP